MIITSKGAKRPDLVWLYGAEGGKPVRAGNEPGELGQTRRRLIDFLQTSDFYEPERLLTHFSDNCELAPDRKRL